MKQTASVAIIGGGPAGMACAITAAECGDSVVLLERMDRTARKLAATGNGRCNLMNTRPAAYPGGDDMARAVLARCGVLEQRRFWQDHGLILREESEGRVYPATLQSSSVVDLLRYHCERLGVQMLTGTTAAGLRQRDGIWQIQTEEGILFCRRAVVAGGGKAQPKLGSNGSCYALLTAQGHTLKPCRPSLTQLETDAAPIRGLSGIRVKATVTLLREAAVRAASEGELLFTDYGVSGICVMELSRDAQPGDVLSVNLAEPMGFGSPPALYQDLVRRRSLWQGEETEKILSGVVLPRLALRLYDAANIRWQHHTAGEITDQQLLSLADVCFDFRIPVTGKRGFESAQVTAGGIDSREFDPDTLQSRLVPGLYAAGEILDVDGPCGGYNLMFAFASGILAGLDGRKSPYRREQP